MTDTERLDFLLQYIRIDDVGDEEYIAGVCTDYERLDETLFMGVKEWSDDIRDVIDRAITKAEGRE